MNLFKKAHGHLIRRYEKFYRGRYFHLSVDLFLLAVIITLISLLIGVNGYRPNTPNHGTVVHQEKIASSTTSTEENIQTRIPKKTPSNLKVQTMIYYHSPQGDQLGSGPIPPIVGIPTTYWLFFKAENSGNEIGTFLMTAKLPSNVVFTGNKTLNAGIISYQADRHLLIWTVNSLAREKATYSAGMEISLTPTQSQVGKNCELANSIHYSADDLEAETELSGNLKNMTSALDFDKINQGQGKVESLD
ncbi:MAG: hypothetical protein ACOYMB_03445 [Patescibacteria group bacterium]